MKMTQAEWHAKGVELFGPDQMNWRFVCPCCGHVACAHDYKTVNAPMAAVGFSCVGRWAAALRGAFEKGPGPCDYAGGGLFTMNPIHVVRPDGGVTEMFAFAEQL